MLALALSISAQNTNQGRATRTSSAVKEKKDSDEVKKSEKPKEKSTEYKTKTATRSKETKVRSDSPSRVRTSTTSSRKNSNYDNEERTRQTSTTRKKEVRTTTTERSSRQSSYRNNQGNENPPIREKGSMIDENRGTRDKGAGSNRKETSARIRTRTNNSITSREYIPRNEQESVTIRKVYTSPERKVVVRTNPIPDYVPRSVEYRRTYYPYHVPPRVDIIWTVRLYNEYRYIYPHYDYWYYPVGYRIHTASAYDAYMYIGEFARIYGRVYNTWYSYETDEYYLYFGETYPYQDFTVIIEGRSARRISRRPERYFTGRHIAVTGIVSVFEGKPEMIVKKRSQIDLYL